MLLHAIQFRSGIWDNERSIRNYFHYHPMNLYNFINPMSCMLLLASIFKT